MVDWKNIANIIKYITGHSVDVGSLPQYQHSNVDRYH